MTFLSHRAVYGIGSVTFVDTESKWYETGSSNHLSGGREIGPMTTDPAENAALLSSLWRASGTYLYNENYVQQ